MYDLFFPVCAKITLIRQQRTRTNIAPNPPYSMLTLGGGSPTNGNERLFHNGTTPPMRANIELGVEGGAFACASGLWMSVIFTHTGPLTINNMVANQLLGLGPPTVNCLPAGQLTDQKLVG